MEIDEYLVVAIALASFAAGAGALKWRYHIIENAELRLSPKIMKKYGLPKTDTTFSHIFTHNKEDRVNKAEEVIDEVSPLIEKDMSKIEDAQQDVEESRKKIERLRKRMEEMRTEGEDEATLMAFLAPELYNMEVHLKEIEYALSSATMLGHHKIFMEQVAKGRERSETLDIMDKVPILKNKAPEMGLALKIFREAVSLAPAEYRKSMEKWIQDKE